MHGSNVSCTVSTLTVSTVDPETRVGGTRRGVRTGASRSRGQGPGDGARAGWYPVGRRLSGIGPFSTSTATTVLNDRSGCSGTKVGPLFTRTFGTQPGPRRRCRGDRGSRPVPRTSQIDQSPLTPGIPLVPFPVRRGLEVTDGTPEDLSLRIPPSVTLWTSDGGWTTPRVRSGKSDLQPESKGWTSHSPTPSSNYLW